MVVRNYAREGFYLRERTRSGKFKYVPIQKKFDLAYKELKPFFPQIKNTPKGRLQIRRLYSDYARYVKYTEPPSKKYRTAQGVKFNFKFQKLTKQQMKYAKASKLFSSSQFTKNGLFIEKPANLTAKEYRLRFSETGVTVIAGQRRDIVVNLDPKKLLVDHKKEIKEALERARKKAKRKIMTYSLQVNGFSAGEQYGVKALFEDYINETLLPDWIDKNEHLHDTKEELYETFADVFHLRLLYFRQKTVIGDSKKQLEKLNKKNARKKYNRKKGKS